MLDYSVIVLYNYKYSWLKDLIMSSNVPLSVIIPHWQNANDLERLLDSIPSDQNYEVIVIDDYSEEKCYKAVQALQNKHNFILLRNTEKKSAGTCRNIGLALARGKWVLFADSDDFFLESLTKEILHFIDSDYDIVFFPPKGVFSDTLEECNRAKSHADKLFKFIENPSRENEYALRFTWNCPWSKLYRRNFLISNTINFEELIAANDVRFSTESGIKAQKIGVSEISIYCATVRKGSLENKITKQIILDRIKANLDHLKICKKYGYKKIDINSSIKYLSRIRYLPLNEWLPLIKKANKMGAFKTIDLYKFLIDSLKYLYRILFSNEHKQLNDYIVSA